VRCSLLSFTVVIAHSAAAFGQQAPAFEVASIKPTKSDGISFHISAHQPIGNMFTAQNATARQLTILAYDLAAWQISGGPDWFNLERYDIEAKPERPGSRDEIYSMVRSMLADRFRLAMHRETKDLPLYNLVLEEGGPKIAINKTGGPPRVSETHGRGVFHNVPISRLTPYLSTRAGRSVVDKTGLTGNYDFILDYIPARDSLQSGGPSGLSIFDALKERLGMKLEPGRGPVEIFHIDHVERPSEN
jgi:bla regulator protein BlaR1